MYDTPLYHLIFSDRRRAVYAPVPKAACSSFKAYLRSLDGLPPIALEELHLRRTNGLTYAQSIDRERLLSILFGKNAYFKFTIVRNPYARLISAYNDVLRPDADGRCRLQKEADRLLDVRRRLIDARPSECDRLKFEEFIEVLPHVGASAMNRHWQPQNMVILGEYIQYDVVAQLERLEESLPSIQAGIGAELPFDIKLNESGEVRVREWYTQKLAAIVRDVYSADFHRFHYDAEI
jgi:hypothetical protein